MGRTKKNESFLKNPLDYTLLITILLLLAMGLIMVLSASSPTAISEGKSSYTYFIRQALFAVLGIVAMILISKIDYRVYKKFYIIAYVLSIILLAVVLVIGREVNGAKRWIYLTESLSFQPSEFVKLFMIIFFATILTKNRDDLSNFLKGWVKHLAFLIPIIGLLIIEPHLSASIVIIGISVIMMILAGCKFLQIFIPGVAIGIPAFMIAIWKIPKFAHAMTRITTFMDPWQDKLGDGWQVIQSLYAVGSRRPIWIRVRSE